MAAAQLHSPVPLSRRRSPYTDPGRLGRLEGRYAREQLAALKLPPAAVQQITVALGIIEYLNGVLHDIDQA